MKKVAYLIGVIVLVLMMFPWPCCAMEPLSSSSLENFRVYKIEVLQVTNIEPFQKSFEGFMNVLKENGLELGKNLKVNRVVIDFDIEKGGFWNRLGVLIRIREEAARIAEVKPDLVLTIGTPATKYAREKITDANIPVVFTSVAIPQAAGATSLIDAGPGCTGATLYMDMEENMKIVKQIFPDIKMIGMVHSDDENGIAHVKEATKSAYALGITVVSREVNKKEMIVPALKELFIKGVKMYAVPLDTYYGLRKYEPTLDLTDFGKEYKIPVITFALVRVPGAVLYVGADFGVVGGLSGQQAIKILKKNRKPDVLPILKQEEPTVLIDPERVKALNIRLPQEILEKKQLKDGFWSIELER
jgi:putative ABC transport system substrate-binding protein